MTLLGYVAGVQQLKMMWIWLIWLKNMKLGHRDCLIGNFQFSQFMTNSTWNSICVNIGPIRISNLQNYKIHLWSIIVNSSVRNNDIKSRIFVSIISNNSKIISFFKHFHCVPVKNSLVIWFLKSISWKILCTINLKTSFMCMYPFLLDVNERNVNI